MEKEFVNYEQALALKELGFDGKCLGAFDKKYKLAITTSEYWDVSSLYRLNDYFGKNTYKCLAPLYQQAFRWFREKHNFDLNWQPMSMVGITCYYDIEIHHPKYVWDMPPKVTGKTYEEAELYCLRKLIEIVKQK